MTARLINLALDELHSTIRSLSEAGVTAADADWIRKPGNAESVAAFIRRQQRGLLGKNPFEMTVQQTLLAFARAICEEGWGDPEEEAWHIPEEVFYGLEKTAPPWPEGRDSFRSLRIRFGHGDEGVALTYAAHRRRINSVFGVDHFDNVERRSPLWRRSNSPPKLDEIDTNVRLLNGNKTHVPVVEWVIIDLSANLDAKTIEAVRGPRSLADEGLVLTWLFPNRIHAIDSDSEFCRNINGEMPQFTLAGYELDSPENDYGRRWASAPHVFRFDAEQGYDYCQCVLGETNVHHPRDEYRRLLPHPRSVPTVR